jgi:hypothetical protein
MIYLDHDDCIFHRAHSQDYAEMDDYYNDLDHDDDNHHPSTFDYHLQNDDHLGFAIIGRSHQVFIGLTYHYTLVCDDNLFLVLIDLNHIFEMNRKKYDECYHHRDDHDCGNHHYVMNVYYGNDLDHYYDSYLDRWYVDM